VPIDFAIHVSGPANRFDVSVKLEKTLRCASDPKVIDAKTLEVLQ
jgi:hypothetical protein